ncbi:TolC family protein [Flavobacterium orientale]|uniref:Transporter n=1 Tax=Flavobacterium orientale TaxID=1756020 RepID=A0A916Y7K0_9FLAO|nr:TolC family protein [Flavobacterium orientale]GGD33583.1 transporter [Flavobacterium orientale]
MNIKNIVLALFLISFSIVSAQENKKWTLQECVNYALENNISIKSSVLDTDLAEIEKKGAIGNFLPSANASSSHSWNIGLNQNITTGLLENQTTQFTSAGFNVGVDIYNGLTNQNRLRRANLSRIASQYQLTKMQEDIALNVANSFLQILFNKENLKVQKEQLATNQKQLERSEQLLDAGVIPRGDLLDMKATVASDEQRVILAENALLISKLSLAQLLQLEDFKTFDIIDQEYDVVQSPLLLQTPESIYEKAKENRTELKIAKTNLEIAERDLAMSRGAYQPRLQGFYSFSTRATSLERVTGIALNPTNPTSVIGFVEDTSQNVVQPNFNPVLGRALPILDQFENNKGQNFGFQLTIPILNGFSVRTNVQRSKVALERSKIFYEQEELTLERNVFTAFTDAKGALNAHEAALTTLEAREESFLYAKERFDVGLMNAFDFNQSQTLLANAQSEVLRTKYDYIFRTKILEFYFGIPIIQNK